MERFYQIIEELGVLLEQQFYVDHNHVCQLIIEEKLAVQIEMDATQEKLLVGSFLCDIPPGKFREEVLKEALIENYMNPLDMGMLSYVEKNNTLTLFAFIPFHNLNAEKLSEHLGLFVEKGLRWKDAIESGNTRPPYTGTEMDTKNIPGFELK